MSQTDEFSDGCHHAISRVNEHVTEASPVFDHIRVEVRVAANRDPILEFGLKLPPIDLVEIKQTGFHAVMARPSPSLASPVGK